MEKFGEWKHVSRVHKWMPEGKATWTVNVLVPGDYIVDLTYSGEGRLVWGVAIENGEHIQNQQNSSHNYQRFPIGWINFSGAGCLQNWRFLSRRRFEQSQSEIDSLHSCSRYLLNQISRGVSEK